MTTVGLLSDWRSGSSRLCRSAMGLCAVTATCWRCLRSRALGSRILGGMSVHPRRREASNAPKVSSRDGFDDPRRAFLGETGSSIFVLC